MLGFLVGGIIGGFLGLLLAPKPGAQTRAELMEMGDAWRTRADEIAAQMAAEMRSRGVPDMSAVGERVGPAVDSLRETRVDNLGRSPRSWDDRGCKRAPGSWCRQIQNFQWKWK